MFAPDGREVLATGVDNLRKAITREETLLPRNCLPQVIHTTGAPQVAPSSRTAGGSLRGTVGIPKVVGAPVSKQDKLRGRNSI